MNPLHKGFVNPEYSSADSKSSIPEGAHDDDEHTATRPSLKRAAASPDKVELASPKESGNPKADVGSRDDVNQLRRASQGRKSEFASVMTARSPPSNSLPRRPSALAVSTLTGDNTTPPNTDTPSALSSGPASSTAQPPSTGSSRTIRGVTPFSTNQPARTPSYPFPYVPGTPRGWSPAFHQPFTVLSPTASGEPSSTPSETVLSGESTPGATFSPFAPDGAHSIPIGDPRYPNPNLYNLVLQLNSEPGLQSWWTCLTKILHDLYLADRVSLALPADANDIENVPWGQKATFNVLGHGDPAEIVAQASRTENIDGTSQVKPNVLQARPGLESRHSYSGVIHAKEVDSKGAENRSPIQLKRPPMPTRAATQQPSARQENPSQHTRLTMLPEASHTSLSDPDFSSIGGEDRRFIPHVAVFPVLHGFDEELDGLIDTRGVNRILNRGQMVTLTRDYVTEPLTRRDSTPKAAPSVPPSNTVGPGEGPTKSNLPFRSVLSPADIPGQRRSSLFEEYEQQPPSPWSQSPAPSPAIQADPEDNPFFAGVDPVADSFNPSATTPDYSAFPAVEAIGVDRANTIIHIPLLHPTQSSTLPSTRPASTPQSPSQARPEDNIGNERKAPMAIISILSPAVPYPPNLTHSLKMLAPHLAASFSIAQQFSMMQAQAVSMMHRRRVSRQPGFMGLPLQTGGLDTIIAGEFDDASASLSGSITSPSDYSGRSRHSPSSSIAGTPGWDHPSGSHASGRHGSDASSGLQPEGETGGYFDRRRGNMPRSVSDVSITNVPGATSNKGLGKKPQGLDSKSVKKAPQDEDAQRNKVHPTATTEKALTGLFTRSDKSPSTAGTPAHHNNSGHLRVNETNTVGADRHSVLHSYGADFGSSFQNLNATRAEASKPAKGADSLRSLLPVEDQDMVPPSERLLRVIIDSLPVQIFTAAPGTGEITWVNSKFLVYRGQEPRQVMKDPWQSIHPEDGAQYREQWDRSLRTGQQLQQKVRLQRFDGNYRWFYVRAAPLKDKRQNIVHWVGTNMDFHEQHIAELNSARQQETAASEAKYRALANSSPQVVFSVNRKKGVTFCNSQWSQYSGQTEAQALGLGFVERVHPEDVIKCRLPTFEEGTGEATNVPTSVPSGPGRSLSNSQASSSGSSETEKASFTSPYHSPTSAHTPQRKLSDLASTGILKVTRDSNGRASYSTEVRLKSKDGEYRWHLVRVLLADKSLRIHDDEETWYGTCTDINDHKTLERDLKETMDEKSRFLSNMSHEIRTPLNGITGMVNFLIDSNLSDEQMEHVNIIRASTEGLRGLINDILDLSKAEAGMIQLNSDWVHVRALIEEVNDLTSAMAIDKGLELNYVVEADVPAQIKGDRFRIRQILLNVIGNAIKFTQTGEVFVRCSVLQDAQQKLKANEMLIQFEVIDTGQGFTEEEAEHLFKRFSQIDGSSTRQHGGTGLGLVISRQLAQLHGGDMRAKGKPGKGSTFMFYINTTLPNESDMPPPDLLTSPMAHPEPPFLDTKTASTKDVSFSTAKLLRDPMPTVTSLSSAGSADMPKATHSVSNSSADSALSTQASKASAKSGASSASSYIPENIVRPPIDLTMPDHPTGHADTPKHAVLPGGAKTPPMLSILVVCPLEHSRAATVQHIDMTLPKHIPHTITARESLLECQKMIGGDHAVTFTHVVLSLQSIHEIVAFMDQLLNSSVHAGTQLIVITDMTQRHKIMAAAPVFNYDELIAERRLRFLFKPLKPSRFGVIFDPGKEREMSTDRNQDSAQQVALTQKQLYGEMTKRLGNRGTRVLLVEDNRVNQMVILKFLSKVSVTVETVLDGVQCTDKVYSKPHGYYSIILCDLHMPNKDGYQTCREIRRWEKHNKYPYLPIIALSANVLGDVYTKCVEAGFNSYVTKPVDFKELSTVMLSFLDSADPSRPIQFMQPKKK